MRTLVIIVIGLLLVAVFMAVARAASGGRARAYRVAFVFFAAAWTGLAAANLWVGVTRAGYTFMEELPIFLVIVLLPTACAWFVQRRLRARARD